MSIPKMHFLYICDNSDGMERNRQVILGKWFIEAGDNFERHHSHINYNDSNWHSAIILNKDHRSKELFIKAYHFTLAQMLPDANN